jgi:hypothetical protein
MMIDSLNAWNDQIGAVSCIARDVRMDKYVTHSVHHVSQVYQQPDEKHT